MSLRPILLLLCALALGLPGAAHAVRVVRGTTPGGAGIVMEAPDTWKAGDPLIVYNHGYGFSLDPDPGVGPLEPLWLAEGYAIAASGYRERGWALFSAMDDNAELIARFTSEFGPPGGLFAVGGSMGGLISLKMLDDPRFAALKGVYALCAPADAKAAWDEALDLRLAYDAVCGEVSGADLPKGDPPLTWAQNLSSLPTSLDDFDNALDVIRTLAPVTICTGLGLPENFRLNSQKDRLATLMRYAQVTDEKWLETQLGYAIYGLSEIVRSPDKLNSRNAFDSRYLGPVSFSTPAIDARIPAIAPDLFAAYDFSRASVPGVVQNAYPGGGPHVPVLSLYTSRDELVRPFHASKVQGSNRAVVFVDEPAPTHCGFTAAEAAAGWNALRRYAASSPAISTNAAASTLVAAECNNAIALGADGPCRIQPNVPAELAGKPRPRISTNEQYGASAQVDASSTGLWFNASRSGEGFIVETYARDNGALAVWFTFPPAGAPGAQRFLIGGGNWVGNGITIDPVIETAGARFGAAFDPAQVQRIPWGTFTFAFDGVASSAQARPGAVRYAGPAATYGSGEIALTQLTQFAAPTAGEAAATAEAFGGAFYNPARDGEGVFFTQDWRTPPGVNAPTILAIWFTYDTNGQQMWLIGQGSGARGPYALTMLRPVGTRFGANFNAAQIDRATWGTATLSFSDCGHLKLDYASTQPGFGSGTVTMQRLTKPIGTQSCAM